MCSYWEARSQIKKHACQSSLKKERVFLHDALGRVLADDIFASAPFPAFELSSMDGYAIASAFCGQMFRVLTSSRVGSQRSVLPVDEPVAIKIFTGSLIPLHADMVVPLEYTKKKGDYLCIERYPKVGEFIRKVGENYEQGEMLLSKGTLLLKQHIGLLASLNEIFVWVYERPKIGIIVSGNEIVELGELARQSCFYNSNGHMLYAAVLECGGIPKLYPILKEDKNQTKALIDRALDECDMVISSGGVSVGEYDFIGQIVSEYELLFWGVHIKPGQKIIGAKVNGKYFFGLPGFPNSTLVTFCLFVRPMIFGMQGHCFEEIIFDAYLQEDLYKSDDRLEFRVCNVLSGSRGMEVNFDGKKAFQSAILNNFCPLSHAHTGLVICQREYKAFERVRVMLV